MIDAINGSKMRGKKKKIYKSKIIKGGGKFCKTVNRVLDCEM